MLARRPAPLADTTGDADQEPSPPSNLLRVGAGLLWENLAELVLLNLAGSLVASPLVGLGLALGFVPFALLTGGALAPVLGGLIGVGTGELRDETSGTTRRFLATIRTRWRPLALLGFVASGATAGCLLTTARILTDPAAVPGWVVPFWLVQGGCLVLLLVLLIYALPLAAAYGVGVRLAVRNAAVLTIAAPLPTLGMVGLLVALAVATLWIGLGMWLIVPVIAAAFLAANCHLQVERLRPAPERE